MGLRVIDRELTHGRIRLPEQRRLLRRALDIPVIHGHALDQPHRGRAVAAGAVDERGLAPLVVMALKNASAALGSAEPSCGTWKVAKARGLGRRLLLFDVGAFFGGEAQVDDRHEPHLLHLDHRFGSDGAGARDGGLEPRRVPDARHVLFGDLLRERGATTEENAATSAATKTHERIRLSFQGERNVINESV